jgi:hypothetical protein
MGIWSVKRYELVGFLALTALLGASFVYHPDPDGGLILCVFRSLTGLPCPGCGLTRSFCALAQGDVSAAFRFHILGPMAYVVVVVYWLRGGLALLGFDGLVARFDGATATRWLPVTGIVVLVGLWLVTLARLGLGGGG